MADEETTEVKAYRKIILGLVLGFLSIIGLGSGIGVTGVYRVDKFTRSDFELGKAQIMSEVRDLFDAEAKDCGNYRAGIRDRLTRVELIQEQVLKTLRNQQIPLQP